MALRTRPAQFPTRRRRRPDRADHRRPRASSVVPDRVRRPAQQGDRRRQRLRPRERDPPGRGDQEPADLRDHDPAVGRADRQPADDRQAVRPARACRASSRELGYDLEGEALDAIYRQAIELADAKKEVTDADLLALVEQRVVRGPGERRARRLERHVVPRRQRHGHGDADGRRRRADGRGDRQRPGQRAVPGGRRGAPAASSAGTRR